MSKENPAKRVLVNLLFPGRVLAAEIQHVCDSRHGSGSAADASLEDWAGAETFAPGHKKKDLRMANATFDLDSFFKKDITERADATYVARCGPRLSQSQHTEDLPPIVLPKIRVRFPMSNLLLAKPVLSRIYYATRSTDENPFPRTPPSPNYLDDPQMSIPSEVFGARVEKLWKYLFVLKTGRARFELDVLDFSLLALAVRGLHQLVKHQILDPPRPDYIAAAKRLLKVLEKLRKRARRAAIGSVGTKTYEKITQGWRQFERGVRRSCINCGRHHTATYFRIFPTSQPPSLRRRRYRELIDEVVTIAEAELKGAKLPIPEPLLMRKWARTFVRSVRRGREFRNSHSEFLITAALGVSSIRSYFVKKVHKSVCEKKDRHAWLEEYQRIWEREHDEET